MRVPGYQSRYELKYWIPETLIPEIREFVGPYTTLDPYLEKTSARQYQVKSVYFDTAGLDFYYAKLDGTKIRKKLRVRTYNDERDFVYLEIKRKYVNSIIKERSKFPVELIDVLINTQCPVFLDSNLYSHSARLVYNRFCQNLVNEKLLATLLVVYEREAFVGRTNKEMRVTIDTNVRSRSQPQLGDLFDTAELFPASNACILELKFNDFMPKWMRTMTRNIGVRHESISKYCLGIGTGGKQTDGNTCNGA